MIRAAKSLLIFASCAVAVLLPAWAADGDKWAVDKLRGKGKDDKAENVSGIACAKESLPRSCLLTDDETQGAQWVTVNDGKITAGAYLPLISDTFGPEGKNKKTVELDGEAVAFHGGKYYVAGSHGHPRDSKGKLDDVKDADEIATRIKANSHLFEIDPSPGGAPPKSTRNLAQLFAAQAKLKPFFNIRLQNNGLNLEGLAIWTNDAGKTELLAGLRGPLIDKQAIIVGAELDTLFGDQPKITRLIELDLEGNGIRDLIRHKDGFLIIGGPSGDEDGVYKIYRWDGRAAKGTAAKTLPEIRSKKNNQRKPEALLPLNTSGDTVQVLVLFDGEDNGGPRAYALEPPQAKGPSK